MTARHRSEVGETGETYGARGDAPGRLRATDNGWPRQSFVSDLAPEPRAELLALGTTRRYEPPEALVRQGDHDTDVYLLISGYVRVVGDSANGQTVLLALRTRGDLVGELAALDAGPRSATVLAATAVHAHCVARPVFQRFLRARPDAGDAVQRSVSRKLRMATSHRVDTSTAPVLERVCGILDRLATTHGHTTAEGVRLDVPLSQVDLAALAGASLPSVQRATATLRRRGVLRTGYLRLVVRDMDALRAIARGADDSN